jgi:hypothetical protein
VKEFILKGYEYVPDANRQTFRNCERVSVQTHVEFSRIKEQLFDRWCLSRKVGKHYDYLRPLILVEESMSFIYSDVKAF